jgi:hypothetical protein
VAPEPPPGDSPEGPDAVEQLQRAVLTLISTARIALDALEAVVADRRRLDELAASGREVVATVTAAVAGWRDDPADRAEGEAPGPGASARAPGVGDEPGPMTP